MKKVFLFLCVLLTIDIMAEKIKVGDLYYERNYTYNTATITCQDRYTDNYEGLISVIIPEHIDCNGTIYTVTNIGEDAFYGCDSLTSITIPKTVTSIGEDAFYGCKSLTSVTIPNNVTSIGKHAFLGCTSLTSITIRQKVRLIGEDAFRACSSLKSIKVDLNNPIYDSRENCNAIIKTSSNKLIVGCQNTIIPNNIKSIGDWAFSWIESLDSIFIPKSVTTIGEGAFAGCIDLKHIQVELGNPIYDSREKCNAIIETSTNTLVVGCKNSVVHNSVTTIGEKAFSSCKSLDSITIPKSVTSIAVDAFKGCSSLKFINVDENNYVYDSRENCNAIIKRLSNTLIIGCQNTIIPNSVTSIGDGAFSDCYSLTSITIPNSVTRIGNYAFAFCDSLISVTIPNSVITIGNYAFDSCHSLQSITIPNSVEYIADEAFSWCYSLTSISFGNRVASIGKRTFEYCKSLKSVIIPNSVKYIGSEAFGSCSSLTSVTIGNNVNTIEWGPFLGCDFLTAIKYAGTKQQWENIKKADDFWYRYTIHCTDGDI